MTLLGYFSYITLIFGTLNCVHLVRGTRYGDNTSWRGERAVSSEPPSPPTLLRRLLELTHNQSSSPLIATSHSQYNTINASQIVLRREVLRFLQSGSITPTNGTDGRRARRINPLLLKLLLDIDRNQPAPPAPSSLFSGLSDKSVVDLAAIGSFTALALAIISKFPVQTQSYIPVPVFIGHDDSALVENGPDQMTDNGENDTSSFQPNDANFMSAPGVDGERDGSTVTSLTETAVTTDIPQFLEVQVGFDKGEPVQVDIVNDGNFADNYSYREPRLSPMYRPHQSFSRRQSFL